MQTVEGGTLVFNNMIIMTLSARPSRPFRGGIITEKPYLTPVVRNVKPEIGWKMASRRRSTRARHQDDGARVISE